MRNISTIGTLSEKTLHAYLKAYIEPDCNFHEKKVGAYYADIYNENGIFEIQTKQTFRLKNKLRYFLDENHKVTVVIPVIALKTLYWLDPDTMESGKGRLSPKRGTFYDAFPELYGIKELLDNPNLCVYLIKVDIEEYRLLNGWSHDKKKGSVCHDRKPVRISGELHIYSTDDYRILIPESLGETFSSKSFAKEANINLRKAQITLNILKHVNAVRQVCKQGNLLIYERMI